MKITFKGDYAMKIILDLALMYCNGFLRAETNQLLSRGHVEPELGPCFLTFWFFNSQKVPKQGSRLHFHET